MEQREGEGEREREKERESARERRLGTVSPLTSSFTSAVEALHLNRNSAVSLCLYLTAR